MVRSDCSFDTEKKYKAYYWPYEALVDYSRPLVFWLVCLLEKSRVLGEGWGEGMLGIGGRMRMGGLHLLWGNVQMNGLLGSRVT